MTAGSGSVLAVHYRGDRFSDLFGSQFDVTISEVGVAQRSVIRTLECASLALRIGAVGIRAGDGPASRPDARGGARSPARLGHHPVGSEVGIAGGAGDGRPARDPGS